MGDGDPGLSTEFFCGDGGGEFLPQVCVRQELQDCLGQGVGIGGGDEEGVLAVGEEFAKDGQVAGDDGLAERKAGGEGAAGGDGAVGGRRRGRRRDRWRRAPRWRRSGSRV